MKACCLNEVQGRVSVVEVRLNVGWQRELILYPLAVKSVLPRQHGGGRGGRGRHLATDKLEIVDRTTRMMISDCCGLFSTLLQ